MSTKDEDPTVSPSTRELVTTVEQWLTTTIVEGATESESLMPDIKLEEPANDAKTAEGKQPHSEPAGSGSEQPNPTKTSEKTKNQKTNRNAIMVGTKLVHDGAVYNLAAALEVVSAKRKNTQASSTTSRIPVLVEPLRSGNAGSTATTSRRVVSGSGVTAFKSSRPPPVLASRPATALGAHLNTLPGPSSRTLKSNPHSQYEFDSTLAGSSTSRSEVPAASSGKENALPLSPSSTNSFDTRQLRTTRKRSSSMSLNWSVEDGGKAVAVPPQHDARAFEPVVATSRKKQRLNPPSDNEEPVRPAKTDKATGGVMRKSKAPWIPSWGRGKPVNDQQ